MSQGVKISCFACVSIFVALPVMAAPKIDKETCAQLRSEQATFIQSGILADIQRGPEWAKSSLGPERIREIELFITLDEQIKFGCREVTLTGDALRAGEAARRLELNPNADPTAPPPAATKDGADANTPASPASTNDAGNAAAGAESGDAANVEPEVKPALKPKKERRVQPADQPKANDAYVPPEAGQSPAPDTDDVTDGSNTP